jgi:hypothetical protein
MDKEMQRYFAFYNGRLKCSVKALDESVRSWKAMASYNPEITQSKELNY